MARAGTGTSRRPPGGGLDGAVSPAVADGLLAAWAVHDLEEVLAFGPWARHALPRLRERFPGIPDRAWRAVESVDEPEFAVAVGIVSVVMAAASAAGQVSGGRSRFFQSASSASGCTLSATWPPQSAPADMPPAWSPHRWSPRRSRSGRSAGSRPPASGGPPQPIIPQAVLALTILGGSLALARLLARGGYQRRPRRAAMGQASTPQPGQAQSGQLCTTTNG